MKLCVVADKDAYFDFFRDSASQATVPGPNTARFKWLTAEVSGQVKSQTRQRPDAHGAMVNPSGLLLSVLSSVLLRTIPVGSNLDGISANANERLMRSLTAEWRKCRPAGFRQDKPWTPNSSVSSPHMHSCGAHTGAPRRRAIAILSDESSSLFPTEEQGRGCQKVSRRRSCRRNKSGTPGLRLCSKQHLFLLKIYERTVPRFLDTWNGRIWGRETRQAEPLSLAARRVENMRCPSSTQTIANTWRFFEFLISSLASMYSLLSSSYVFHGSSNSPTESCNLGEVNFLTRSRKPATDDKNAGKAKSVAKRTPIPPLEIGSEAWSHDESDNEMLRMSCKVFRIVSSYCFNRVICVTRCTS